MENIKKNKSEKIFRILGALTIIFLFTLLFLRYFSNEIFPPIKKENPRFVNVDYASLETEAGLIKSRYGTTNVNAKNIVVLTYHRITKDTPQREYEISYEQFKENMFTLKKQGYQTITTQDLYSFMKGEKQLPEKSFVLTFDDGAKQSFYNGDPILRALNFSAVFFIIASHSIENVSSPYYLNKSELETIIDTKRWEIESHTYQSHYRLPIGPNNEIGPALTNKLWIENNSRLETDQEYYNRVNSDLQIAKNTLEKNFNINVDSFALPYGDFGERNSNYPNSYKLLYSLTTKDYKLVFYEFPLKYSAYRGNYNDKNMNSYIVSRIPADSLQTPERLIQRIESANVVELPYYENYANPDKWIRINGEATFYSDSITLLNGTIGNIQGVFAYLDGSYLLTDYTYSVQLKNSAAREIILISRFKDPLNYVTCRYVNNSVSIVEYSNEIPFNNVNKTIAFNAITNGTILSMSIKNSHVKCYIDGREIIESDALNIPSYGGVGIRAQNFDGNDKTFSFGRISITKL